MKLFPINISSDILKIDFIGKGLVGYFFTSLLILLSFITLSFNGLNYGIDFTGGILIEARSKQAFDLATLRSDLNSLNLGDISLQNLGSENDLLVRVGVRDKLGNENILEILKSNLKVKYPNIEYRKVDFVGPQVGKELVTNGIYVTFFSFLAIMLYIWFRFEWQYSFGMILALMHDAIVTLGFISLFGIEFKLESIAAILTVIGYSVNDSVVIYDRIRENIRKYRNKPLTFIINSSLNETLARTILTVVTTLLATLSLILFASEALSGFAKIIFVGIVIGTYSSIYISAPILIKLKLKNI